MFPKRNSQGPTGKYEAGIFTKEGSQLKTQDMTKKRQSLSRALASEQDSGGFRGVVLCGWRTEWAGKIRSQRVANQVTFEKMLPTTSLLQRLHRSLVNIFRSRRLPKAGD